MIMQLSPYACKDEGSKGRLYPDTPQNHYCCFQRDRNRILHSLAFRRLEYKTQVFINYVGDHYRTRLTHSLEVSQIARDISRALHLNEDLAEAVALAHDLGHPPFGHAGEEGLNLAAARFGGFDHNAHAIKIITLLEQRYANYPGLNLTWETLEGIAKHNGPLQPGETGHAQIINLLSEEFNKFDAPIDTFPALEAQVAAIADDIAYCNHDIDDGIRAGFFQPEELEAVPTIWALFKEVYDKYPDATRTQLLNESIKQITSLMIEDLLVESRQRIVTHKIKDYADIRIQTIPLIGFSAQMEKAKNDLKQFLLAKVYRHYKINRISYKSKLVVQHLFATLYEHPNCLPTEWQNRIPYRDDALKAQVIIDYIAGMTDRYALKLYKQICDLNAPA